MENTLAKMPLLGISISVGSYKQFVSSIIDVASQRESNYACLANVHMLVEACRHPDFAIILSNAYVVTPDGMPLTWSLKILNHIKQERVSGMDLLPDLL